MTAVENEVLDHILAQIEADLENDLRKDAYTLTALYLATQIDWHNRVEERARLFVPHLVACSQRLIARIQEVIYAPFQVRIIAQAIADRLATAESQKVAPELVGELQRLLEKLDENLGLEFELLTKISGEMVGDIVADFLCNEFSGQLKRNNSSTYPDLYFADADYKMLQKRSDDNTHLPAMKGNDPSGIPDGLEIKSKRTTKAGGSISADCHYHYQGMHLAITFYYAASKKQWVVDDAYLAYLSFPDYKEATRTAKSTTVKYSFKHKPFISLTKGKAAMQDYTLQKTSRKKSKKKSGLLLPFEEIPDPSR